jgi:hypothetical protein
VFGRRTAFVIDPPGDASVMRGLQLAGHGYRPVPLYNTSHALGEVVDTNDLIAGLHTGRTVLPTLSIPADAPPVFLLDSARLPHRMPVLPGKYENRRVVLPQDFPSGNFVRDHGIDTVLLWQTRDIAPREDPAHVLRRWRDAGLRVFLKHGAPDNPPALITVKRPGGFRSLFHRFAILSGLRRSSAGGFGSVVPQPSPSGGYG